MSSEDTKTLSFDSFANFKYADNDKAPSLPVKNSPELISTEVAAGAFTTTIDIGDGKVAKIEALAIVNSPRREIERNLQRNLNKKQLQSIPDSEIALMEIWEKVDDAESFSNKSFEELNSMFDDPIFKIEMRGFANAVLALMIEKRVMIDICDSAGIRGKSKPWKRLEIKSLGDLARLDDVSAEKTVLYPRNTTFDNGKIKYYDIFPIKEIDAFVSETTLTEMRNKLRESDWYGLEGLIVKGKYPSYKLNILRYLVLLQKMGADI